MGLLVPTLSARYRLISLDCRGLGESDPEAEPVSFEAAADDIAGLLDLLGVRRAHVLGWSWGSGVAQHFALLHPARLGSLVLWSTWPRTDGCLRAVFSGIRYPFAQKDVETAVTVTVLGLLHDVSALPPGMRGERAFARGESLDGLPPAREAAEAGDPLVIAGLRRSRPSSAPPSSPGPPSTTGTH